MSMPLIAPSLLAADFARLGEEAEAVLAAGADWLHLDVMDGHFVPNLTFGPDMVRALRRRCPQAVLDTHLMISPVDPLVAAFAEAGASRLTVHVEAGAHLHRTCQLVRSHGLACGVTLNPGTPAHAIAEVLDLVDLVLVMTVNPGFGGQAFIDSQQPKIVQIAAMIRQSGRPIHLQVDGGIKPQTAATVVDAGATVLVAGSAIFAQPDYAAAIAALKRAWEPRA